MKESQVFDTPEEQMTDHARPNWAPGMGEDGPQEKSLSDAEFKTIAVRNPHQAFLIAGHSRPGFVPFMQELEYFHYAPDTERNALFELVYTKWQEMLWITVAIPLVDMPIVVELGKKYGFDFRQRTMPFAIVDTGHEFFPMDPADNIFSVNGFLRDEAKVKELEKEMEQVIEAHINKVENEVGA